MHRSEPLRERPSAYVCDGKCQITRCLRKPGQNLSVYTLPLATRPRYGIAKRAYRSVFGTSFTAHDVRSYRRARVRAIGVHSPERLLGEVRTGEMDGVREDE